MIAARDAIHWATHLVGRNPDRIVGALAHQIERLLSDDPRERQIAELALRKWVDESKQPPKENSHE